MHQEPLVSVVTPVYNGEDYFAECIESILNQTYRNLEYIIVNNASTDRTLEIAQKYAAIDSRVRIHTNEKLVPIMENHNIGLNLISPESKYCKVVCADDLIFPDCLTRMVEVAEANPSVGIVGSYQLSGTGANWRSWGVKWTELPYPSTVIPGREICRSQLLDGVYVFGTPTSTMYRADLIRADGAFYPTASPHADTSACYDHLKESDFGFVHQVLSYERVHEAATSATCRKLNSYESSRLSDLVAYGPSYLTKDELKQRTEEVLTSYYDFLTACVLDHRDTTFWKHHKSKLSECGYPLSYIRLTKHLCVKLLDLALNPKHTAEKFARRAFQR
jgi:glycosyltransferase involved in cell wall biosynthesis